jgi:hypothetical protein
MLSVPSPTEYVPFTGLRRRTALRNVAFLSFFFFHRLEVYFHTCDELLHIWAHAEDLDTLEFALMQVISYIAGPVRTSPIFIVPLCC